MVTHGQHAQSVLNFVTFVCCGLKKFKKCTNSNVKYVYQNEKLLNIPNLVAKPPSQSFVM